MISTEKKNPTERSCSVCRLKTVKSDLTRVAMFPAEKRLELDPSGLLGGRGLYVCKSQECVRNFIKMVKNGKIKYISKFPGRSKERLIERIQEYGTGSIKNGGG